MTCLFCKQGQIRPGRVTVMLERGETLVIFKDVPGDICENCGEYFLSSEVTGQLLERAEEAIHKGAEVEILRFAA
jgi:YgiT-type zinc finger domain-containing protein